MFSFAKPLQFLAIHTRKVHISSLQKYSIKLDPDELRTDFISELNEDFKRQLDLHREVYYEHLKELESELFRLEDSSHNKNSAIQVKVVKDGVRDIKKCLASIKNKTLDLHLVCLYEDHTISTSKEKLYELGLKPASFLECLLFVQKYADNIAGKLPLIALDAYFAQDDEQRLHLKKDGKYVVSYLSGGSFGRIGDAESGESLLGLTYTDRVYFLVKE